MELRVYTCFLNQMQEVPENVFLIEILRHLRTISDKDREYLLFGELHKKFKNTQFLLKNLSPEDRKHIVRIYMEKIEKIGGVA